MLRGSSVFATTRKTGAQQQQFKNFQSKGRSMAKTTWYDPKLGNIEYLTPQGKRLHWS